jgi:predicted transcriptional regulator
MSREAMDIEDVLYSKTRLKILELLMKSELLNTSEIAKQVGVSHSKAKEHLKIREDEGILIYRMFGSRTGARGAACRTHQNLRFLDADEMLFILEKREVMFKAVEIYG